MNRFCFVCLLFVSAFCGSGFSASSPSSSVETLCGVTLNPKLAQLAQSVSQYYGNPVQCVEGTLPGARGMAMPIKGEPKIVIAHGDADQLEIAHELLHLQLGAEGFDPIFRRYWLPPAGALPAVTNERIRNFQALVYDELQHRLMFPRFLSLGIIGGDRKFTRDVIAGIDKKPISEDNREFDALYILRLSDAGETRVLKQYEHALEAQGFTPQVIVGEQFIREVKRDDPRTTDAAVKFSAHAAQLIYSNRELYAPVAHPTFGVPAPADKLPPVAH